LLKIELFASLATISQVNEFLKVFLIALKIKLWPPNIQCRSEIASRSSHQ